MRYGQFTVFAGDRVTIRTPHGERIGRAQSLLLFPDHCVLNCGGRYGTPAVADATNIVKVIPSQRRAT